MDLSKIDLAPSLAAILPSPSASSSNRNRSSLVELRALTHLVPDAHYSERQDKDKPFSLQTQRLEVDLKLIKVNIRIFIFCSLGTNGLGVNPFHPTGPFLAPKFFYFILLIYVIFCTLNCCSDCSLCRTSCKLYIALMLSC